MSEIPLICHRCAAQLQAGRGAFYVIRIEAVADPSPPVITDEDLARDRRDDIRRLIESMGDLSGQEALDQVYRRMTLHLCNRCYAEWIENPVGSAP